MVSKKEIKSLDFSTIEEYYYYILESYINGQRQQAKSLFLKCSKDQKKEFLFNQGFELKPETKEFFINLL